MLRTSRKLIVTLQYGHRVTLYNPLIRSCDPGSSGAASRFPQTTRSWPDRCTHMMQTAVLDGTEAPATEIPGPTPTSLPWMLWRSASAWDSWAASCPLSVWYEAAELLRCCGGAAPRTVQSPEQMRHRFNRVVTLPGAVLHRLYR